MSTSKNEEISKLFNKLENIDKADLEAYYKSRKECFDEERETFPLTRSTIDDLEDVSLYECVDSDEWHYKHAMTTYHFVVKRLSDNKFFSYNYTADYNEGICDWSLEDVEQVFPILKVISTYD